MDVAKLNCDMIGLILSYNRNEYAKLVQVCKQIKSILNNMNIDGWDALIAQGVSVEITSDYISWTKNGKQHMDRDLPAYIKPDGTRIWFYNGVKHRDNNPAAVYFEHGVVSRIEWHKNGILHNETGPAIIEDCHIAWIQDGTHHRECDLPAVITCEDGIKLEYYNRGLLHREHHPATIYIGDINNISDIVYIEDWSSGEYLRAFGKINGVVKLYHETVFVITEEFPPDEFFTNEIERANIELDTWTNLLANFKSY